MASECVCLGLLCQGLRAYRLLCSRLVVLGEAAVVEAFPKDAVNPSMGAWCCHPWQHTLLRKLPPQPLETPCNSPGGKRFRAPCKPPRYCEWSFEKLEQKIFYESSERN